MPNNPLALSSGRRQGDGSPVRAKGRVNQHDPVGELRRFVNICGEVRNNLNPETIKANVGRRAMELYDSVSDDGKSLLNELANLFRGPR